MTKTNGAIPPELVDAYNAANYEVRSGEPFVLNIGTYSHDLKSLFEDASVRCACFITAYNPFSESVSPEANFTALEKLRATLLELEKTVLDGIGSDPSSEWEGEPSFFVLGLSLEESKTIGKEFKQNAVVWCSESCIPELILLR